MILAGWWEVTLPHGVGAWRQWRCIMTRGNIDMECPTQGNLRKWRSSKALIFLRPWILCLRLQWPCVNVKHVLGTWMKSWGCQKPSTCFLTWTGALLPFRWGFSSVFDLSLMRQGEQWFPGSCLFWTERRGALSNCVGCVGSLWGEATQQIPYFPFSWHFTW